jgi:dihydrofolate synthase/folylpolyglutamate synthase
MTGYSDTLDYLYGLEKFGIVFGLDNIRWILGLIGNPQDTYPTVHIAGTNGKGSVARMVACMLQAAGYRVGTYTSPHLVSFTERITIGDEPITEREVVELTDYVRGLVEKSDPDRFFTFFDFTTALAFEHFRRQLVEVGVIEVGLGGRLDSTNVLRPVVSVITNVTMDHTDYLGDDLAGIAREKAGIVKEGVPVVTAAEGIPLKVIKETATDRSTVYACGEDFSYTKTGDQLMTYEGLHMRLEEVRVGLRGDHQLVNGAVALGAGEVLASRGFRLGGAEMRQGLDSVRWPGRLELVNGRTPLLLDGAHNADGAQRLASYLGTHFTDKKRVLVFGAMKDKDLASMLGALAPCVEAIVLTRPAMERAADPDALLSITPGALVTHSVAEGLDAAGKLAADGDLIVVTGSLYTVGEAKKLLDATQ